MRLEALRAAEENREELIAYFLFYKKFLKVSKVKTVFSKLHLPNAVAFFYPGNIHLGIGADLVGYVSFVSFVPPSWGDSV